MAAAAPFELELLAIVVAVADEVAFAALPCLLDEETEGVVAPAADWLEVVAAARAAMLRAKVPKNCILLVAKVLIAKVLV